MTSYPSLQFQVDRTLPFRQLVRIAEILMLLGNSVNIYSSVKIDKACQKLNVPLPVATIADN